MTSNDLTPAQAQRLHDHLRARLIYLHKLVERMDRQGWDPQDPLYLAAARARDSMQDVAVLAQNAAVRAGVGGSGSVG